MISQSEHDLFVDYIMDFYGEGIGIYADEMSNGSGYTEREVGAAVDEYLEMQPDAWGGGDTFDREAVITILDPVYGRDLY